MNKNEEQQHVAEIEINNEMSYIDRLVIENGGTADDVNIDIPIRNGEEDDESDEEDNSSIWSGTGESSDEEMMDYDSDEDSIQSVKITKKRENHTTSEVGLSEESKQLLLWRLDKDVSFSDWTIEVSITNKGNSKKTYHVHKTSLGLGPKRSGYFETLLKSGQFSESSNSTSVVELPMEIANYFDVFLDYLYSPPSECTVLISRYNRCALQYLAKYFLVSKLSEDIGVFIGKDMNNLENMEGYLTEFGNSEDDESRRMVALATRACASNILHIRKPDPTFVYTLSPVMFLHIIAMVRKSNIKVVTDDDDKFFICALAIDYIKQKQSMLNANYFDALASELYFPISTIDAGVLAVRLLEVAESNSGWVKHLRRSIVDMCTALLSRYALEMCQSTQISTLYENLPKDVICRVLGIVLACQSKKESTKKTFTVSCKFMTDCYGHPAYIVGRMGSVVKIPVKPTDTVGYFRYRLERMLKSGTSRRMKITCNEFTLTSVDELVSNTSISSCKELKIY